MKISVESSSGKIETWRSSSKQTTSNKLVVDNNRHQINYVRSGNIFSLFIDGEFDNSSSTGTSFWIQNMVIWAWWWTPNTGAWRWGWSIDEVRIYNRALTSWQILNIYKSNLAKYDNNKRKFSYTTTWIQTIPGYHYIFTGIVTNTFWDIYSATSDFYSTQLSTPILLSPISWAIFNTWIVNILRMVTDTTAISGYIYQLSTGSSFTTFITSGTITTTGKLLTWLTDNRYYRRVVAYNNLNNTWLRSTISNFTVDTIAPTAPLLLSPSDGSGLFTSTVNFVRSWSSDTWAGVSGYVYQISTDTGFTDIVMSWTRPTTGVTIAGLSDGQYYRRTYGFDKAYNSWSRSTTFGFSIDTVVPPVVGTGYISLWTTGTNYGNLYYKWIVTLRAYMTWRNISSCEKHLCLFFIQSF